MKLLLPALLCAFALSACSNANDVPAEHSQADRSEGHTSSSAGLPEGHIDAGEKIAHTKNKSTGQACVDCHGAEGNAPIDPSYPKLGGQYSDYLAHAIQQYRDGDRKHALMTAQIEAANFSDQDIADVAAYFGSRVTKLHDLQHQ